ncbi:hypothetical protein J3F83DRAFT_742904 [Trichoderma novae-zelandiae]
MNPEETSSCPPPDVTPAPIGTVPRPEQRRSRVWIPAAQASKGSVSFDIKVSEAAYVGLAGTSSLRSRNPSSSSSDNVSVGLPLAVSSDHSLLVPVQFSRNLSALTGSDWLQPMPRSSKRRPQTSFPQTVAPGVEAACLPCGMKPFRRCQPRKADNGRPTTARLKFRRHRIEE